MLQRTSEADKVDRALGALLAFLTDVGPHRARYLNERSVINYAGDMGRQRGYDEGDVLDRAAAAFLRAGYEGTSIEELVTATGLHRGSLYQAFGSKRGLFVSGLRRQVSEHPGSENTTDLVLVALLELAPRDEEVRGLLGEHLDRRGVTANDLGRRLLTRALMDETKDD